MYKNTGPYLTHLLNKLTCKIWSVFDKVQLFDQRFAKGPFLLSPWTGVFGDFQPGQAFLSTSTMFYDIFSLLWATFYWACFQFKKFRDTIIKTSKFYHILGMRSQKQVCSEFICQISQHFRVYVRLHWADPSYLVSLERPFPPVEVEYRWCQFWSKVMM